MSIKRKLLSFSLFNNSEHYPFEKTGDSKGSRRGDSEHEYHFTSDSGTKYHVNIDHSRGDDPGRKEAYVSFHPVNLEIAPNKTKYEATGKEGVKSAKILGSVHHIVKHHLAAHSDIHKVTFSSSGKESTRTRLYRHIAKRLSPHHEESEGFNGGTEFHIYPHGKRGR